MGLPASCHIFEPGNPGMTEPEETICGLLESDRSNRHLHVFVFQFWASPLYLEVNRACSINASSQKRKHKDSAFSLALLGSQQSDLLQTTHLVSDEVWLPGSALAYALLSMWFMMPPVYWQLQNLLNSLVGFYVPQLIEVLKQTFEVSVITSSFSW